MAYTNRLTYLRKPYFAHLIPFSQARADFLRERRELFFVRNRVEVRQIYRELLKNTAKAIPRKLEREAQLAEIQLMFRECKHEQDIDQINEIKQVMYTVLDRIEHGVYPPFFKEYYA